MNIQLKTRQQKGFTIIELVVVILLLGILAATALPRFLDVTTEAHDAVVDGVRGSLQTGVLLARASWVARGQPAGGQTLEDFNTLPVNSNGYVGGSGTAGALAENSHADCVSIYQGLLQEGGRVPVIASDDTGQMRAIDNTDIALATEGFIAKQTAAGVCTYAYVGDAARRTADVPLLTYTATTGVVATPAVLTPAARPGA